MGKFDLYLSFFFTINNGRIAAGEKKYKYVWIYKNIFWLTYAIFLLYL